MRRRDFLGAVTAPWVASGLQSPNATSVPLPPQPAQAGAEQTAALERKLREYWARGTRQHDAIVEEIARKMRPIIEAGINRGLPPDQQVTVPEVVAAFIEADGPYLASGVSGKTALIVSSRNLTEFLSAKEVEALIGMELVHLTLLTQPDQQSRARVANLLRANARPGISQAQRDVVLAALLDRPNGARMVAEWESESIPNTVVQFATCDDTSLPTAMAKFEAYDQSQLRKKLGPELTTYYDSLTAEQRAALEKKIRGTIPRPPLPEAFLTGGVPAVQAGVCK